MHGERPAIRYPILISHIGDANMKTLEAETLTDGSVSIKKILVAVDLSDHSEATALYAAQMAQCFGASLTVAHIYEPVPLCEYASETTYTVLEDERAQL
jgi:Universal stress protein family